MKTKRLLILTASIVLAAGSAQAADVTGSITVDYTPGSKGVALTGLNNKLGANIFDWRINLFPYAGEAADFNLDASDCDVDPGDNPAGDAAGPPDFDPEDDVDDREVTLDADGTNDQLDAIMPHPGENNPFSVVAGFTKAATTGGKVVFTPTDIDGHDMYSPAGSGIKEGCFKVPLSPGAEMVTVVATYTGAEPLDRIGLTVTESLRFIQADVNGIPGGCADDGCYCPHPDPCWNDSTSYPDFNVLEAIPPSGLQSVTLLPASAGDVITTGTSFVIQFGLKEPVSGTSDSVLVVIGKCDIPTLTEWGMIIMFVVLAGGIIWFVVRQRRRVATA